MLAIFEIHEEFGLWRPFEADSETDWNCEHARPVLVFGLCPSQGISSYTGAMWSTSSARISLDDHYFPAQGEA